MDDISYVRSMAYVARTVLRHAYPLQAHMSKSNFIFRRCMTCGLSRDHSRLIARYYSFQVYHRGYLGAVDLFKKFGDTIVFGLTASGSKPEWVDTAFRYPKKLAFLRKYPADVQLRIAKIARSIRLKQLVQRQVTKSVNAVQEPYSGSLVGLCALSQLIQLGMSTKPKWKEPLRWNYPLIGRQFKTVMSESGKVKPSSAPPIRESVELVVGTIFERLPRWKEAFLPLAVKGSEGEDVILERPRVVGEIHASQEGAAKLRMFAAPYSIFQVLLTPLHEWLADYRKNFSTDCTYDQSEGAIWAQNQLRLGKTLVAADLTSATCRFPLEPQLEMLTQMGIPQEWIDCLEAVCRGLWRVGDELTSTSVAFPSGLRWNVGQPLGIKPSMSMFSTAHNCLLSGICKMKGLDPDSSFRVLGDDTVMVEELFDLYSEVLTSCGVPINMQKTHKGNTFAEFAGYAITSGTLLRPGQWRLATIQNILGLAKDLGPLRYEVSKEWLELQEFELFRLGDERVKPSVEQWNKFLFVNSKLQERSLEYPTLCKTTFEQGFRMEAERQLGECKFYPRNWPNYTAIYWDLFKDYPDPYGEPYGYHLVGELEVFNDSFVVYCTDIVRDLFALGRCSLHEAADLIEKAAEAVYPYLWMPPRVKSKGDKFTSGSYIRKLRKYIKLAESTV